MSSYSFMNNAYPMVALRGFVIFPTMVLNFDVGRKKSIAAIRRAMETDQLIFLSAQKDLSIDNPSEDDVFKVGVISKINQIIKTTDGGVKVMVEGICRAKVESFIATDPYLLAQVVEHPLQKVKNINKNDALMRTIKMLFDEYSALSPRMPKDIISNIHLMTDPVEIVEFIAGNLVFKALNAQKILEQSNPTKRLEQLVVMMESENSILSLEQEILENVREQMDKNQKDYFLREQLKVISNELGEGEEAEEEYYRYKESIEKLGAPKEVVDKLNKEVEKLVKLPYSSQEAAVVRNYIETCLELPYSIKTKTNTNIERARKTLNKDHYGLDKVKDRVLEVLAVLTLKEKVDGQIICLVGPPGVGKTSVAKSVAKAMGRNYVRIALGGVKDESDIRGHRKTYVGSMPGRIIDGFIKAKSKNPLILLDEIDKLSSDYKGDPSSALLEVLDSEQNMNFRDHYIEMPFDVSEALFLTTANSLSSIPAPLLDRMDVIELGSYTRDEKFNIAKKYLISKQMEKNGIKKGLLKIKDDAIFEIIDRYTRESGVRTLEREIAKISRKTAMKIVDEKITSFTVTKKELKDLLGKPTYNEDANSKKDEVGVVNGLAWTSVGGELLTIEVATMPGTGKIEITGNLGKVMEESAKAAVSYVKSISDKLKLPENFISKLDVHIHAPEGAIPKDGPSAGITITTAIVSSLLNIPVRHNIAMTGEVTIRGRVLPIGGLKEKSMAAHRSKLDTVIMPFENIKDLDDIDPAVLKDMKFIPVKNVLDVIVSALADTEMSEHSFLENAKVNLMAEQLTNPDFAIS